VNPNGGHSFREETIRSYPQNGVRLFYPPGTPRPISTVTEEARMNAGDHAPDFSLEAHDGTQVRLSDYLGKKNVVVFFYPKDDTPG
jgi:hypothetical protein